MSSKFSCNFTSGYDDFRIDFQLCIEDEQLICIIGPNASGKTTILKTILTILKPIKGYVKVFEKELHKLNSVERAKLISAVLSEKVHLPIMKVLDVIALGRTPYRGLFLNKSDFEVIEKAIKLCNLQNYTDKYFNELSDGLKQKVLIARAIAQNTKVIVLDEPTTHLDPVNKHEIMKILRKLVNEERKIVIVTTHDLELLPYCDLVIGVKNGKIVFIKKSEEITDEDIEQLYGISNIVDNDSSNVKIHVFSGFGSGKNIFITLWKLDIPFTTGILPEYDIDYYYAKKFSVKIFKSSERTELQKHLEKIDIIIDSGFKIEKELIFNFELIKQYLNKKIVITFRNDLGHSVKVRSIQELRKILLDMLKK